MNNLKNKVVVITGASSGIGQSCALQFASQGSKVVLVARDEQRLQAVAAKIGGSEVLVVPADITSPTQVKDMVDKVLNRFKRVDVLVNNAGVGIKSSILTTPFSEYEKMMATNVYGVLHGIRAVYPHMKEQGDGTIVNVSSVAGFKGFIDCGLYSSTKFAVNGLTESLSEEARKDNINVLLVCPGKVETEFENNVLYREGPVNNKRKGITADKVAHTIVDAVKKNKKMVVVGSKCMPLYLLNRLSPRLTNYIIRYIY